MKSFHSNVVDFLSYQFLRAVYVLSFQLATWNLTIPKAQELLDRPRTLSRQLWAKQSLLQKELEKIAYDQHKSKERRQIARNIIKGKRATLCLFSQAIFGQACFPFLYQRSCLDAWMGKKAQLMRFTIETFVKVA